MSRPPLEVSPSQHSSAPAQSLPDATCGPLLPAIPKNLQRAAEMQRAWPALRSYALHSRAKHRATESPAIHFRNRCRPQRPSSSAACRSTPVPPRAVAPFPRLPGPLDLFFDSSARAHRNTAPVWTSVVGITRVETCEAQFQEVRDAAWRISRWKRRIEIDAGVTPGIRVA